MGPLYKKIRKMFGEINAEKWNRCFVFNIYSHKACKK